MHINDKGDLVMMSKERFASLRRGEAFYYIAASHVASIYDRIKNGVPWWQASLTYSITREQAGFILAHYEEWQKGA